MARFSFNGNLAANYQCQTCFESILAPLTFGLYFDAKDKADLPLHSERVEEVRRVKEWMSTNSCEQKLRKRKRTPLTVPRKHSLRRGGVKTTPSAQDHGTDPKIRSKKLVLLFLCFMNEKNHDTKICASCKQILILHRIMPECECENRMTSKATLPSYTHCGYVVWSLNAYMLQCFMLSIVSASVTVAISCQITQCIICI